HARREGIRGSAESTRRAEELLRLYDDRGKAAFHETQTPAIALFPSRQSWYGAADSPEMLRPLGLVTLLLALSIALLGIAGPNQDLSKVEWTLEWWFTFPVPARGLLLARVLETAVATPFAWFLLFPFFFVTFWCAGYSWFSVPLAWFSMTYI